MSKQGKVSLAVVIGGAFLAGILFATAGANLFGAGDVIGTSSQAAALDGSTTIKQSQQVNGGPGALQTSFTKVADAVNPAVVQIRATKVVTQELPTPFEGTPWGRFFEQPERKFKSRGLGSGVFIRSDGHLVTNYHVVENADELKVIGFEGNTYDAKVVGADPTRDLAVLKVNAEKKFTAVSFGNSDQLQTGQWVLAFGSPLSQSLKNSVTAGIVSAIGRLRSPPQRQRRPAESGQQISMVQNFIQTDAAINPGNSGGPLVDLKGRLVGINTAIASNTGGYQGIGFAIPSNTVRRVATEIIKTGGVRRAYLGVRYGPAEPSLIKNSNLPEGSAIVSEVVEGSPADSAGLQAGDIITAINGKKLQKYLQIGNKIASMNPGEKVTLTIDREGETKKITVSLGSADEGDQETASAQGDAPSKGELMKELGMKLRNVTPEIARKFGLEEAKGVLITDVNTSNPILRGSGLRPNLIIIEIAGTPTPNLETFRSIYSKIDPGQNFRVVVRSPQGFVNVTSLQKPEE
ncbi:MAG: trypsin-like peptidase domain-containing protein [Salinibacter sp.]